MAIQAENFKTPRDKTFQLEQKVEALEATVKLLHKEKQSAIEKRYKESQERFQTIFEQSKMGNKIINADLEIIKANKAVQLMLGYSEKELVGTKIIDYSQPEFVKHWHELQECLWTKKIPSFQIETCLIKKDGTTLWCCVTSILFTDTDITFGFTTLEDVSLRKALEKKLEKQSALINNDLDNFIYTACHDLKAPVANIEGLMTVLTKKLTSRFSLEEDQNKIISMINISLNKVKSTITDLTQIAKVQKEDVEEETVHIDQLIEEVYKDLVQLLDHIPVKLHKHLAVKEIIFAKKYIQSIFYNLLSNAIKYRSVERTPEITVETQRHGRYLLIQVSDNGMGMAEKNLPKIFMMFKRFHSHVEGTGIGLYIVKRIVENAGGKIEVVSKLEVGTTFRVYLPIWES